MEPQSHDTPPLLCVPSILLHTPASVVVNNVDRITTKNKRIDNFFVTQERGLDVLFSRPTLGFDEGSFMDDADWSDSWPFDTSLILTGSTETIYFGTILDSEGTSIFCVFLCFCVPNLDVVNEVNADLVEMFFVVNGVGCFLRSICCCQTKLYFLFSEVA